MSPVLDSGMALASTREWFQKSSELMGGCTKVALFRQEVWIRKGQIVWSLGREVFEYKNRLLGRHQVGRDREIKTKVRTVAYWSKVPEETGRDDIFIFLNCSFILSVIQIKNISSSEPVGPFHILRPQTSSHLVCQKTLFAIHHTSPQTNQPYLPHLLSP